MSLSFMRMVMVDMRRLLLILGAGLVAEPAMIVLVCAVMAVIQRQQCVRHRLFQVNCIELLFILFFLRVVVAP